MSNSHLPLQKTGAFLKSHALSGTNPPNGQAAGPFVTISRESGAGATTLAKKLADRLDQIDHSGPDWTVFGANLIDEMLQQNQLPSRLAEFLPESRISEINALIGEMVGLHPNLWELVQKTNELIRKLARQGNAIFVGRGAVFASADIPNGVHVRLVAAPEYRAKRTAARLGISLEAALAHDEKKDAARRAYVKANFGASGPDPRAYHLVLNAEKISQEDAVEMIVSLVRAQRPVTSAAR